MREPTGTDIRGTYNSFLNQNCRLRIVSRSGNPEVAIVSMTRFDGTQVLTNLRLGVPAIGAAEVDLCSRETEPAYGEVRVRVPNQNFVAETLRQNTEGLVEFRGPVE